MRNQSRRRKADSRGPGERLRSAVRAPWLETALTLILFAYVPFEKVFKKVFRFKNYYFITCFVGLLLLVVVLERLREQKRRPPLELWLLGGNAAWMVFTRLLLGHMQINLGSDAPALWALTCVSVFAFAFYLEGERRERVLDGLLTGFWALHLVLAVLGILTVLFGNLPVVSAVVSLRTENGVPPLTFLSFLRVHRNIACGFFYAALAMAVLQFLRHRTAFWRWAAAASVPIFYVVISLQHCRSIFLTTSAYLALVIGMAVQERLERRGVWLRLVCVGLVSAVCTAVLFVGFGRCSDAVVSLAESLAQRRAVVLTPVSEQAGPEALTAQLSASALTPEPPAPEQQVQISDQRDTLEDARTLTGRTEIWEAMVRAIRAKPRIALLGTDETKMMKLIQRYGPEDPKEHLHHVLFQQLMTAGVPSFLLCLGYLALLFFRSARCFLELGAQAAERRGLAALLLPMMLIYGSFEPLMSYHSKVMTLVFLLCAGLLVRQDMEARERGGRS